MIVETVVGHAENPSLGEIVQLGAVLGDVGLSYDDIVKTTIFVTDMNDFAAVNAVYGEYVGDARPARSTVEVSALPGGFVVEIETIAAR